MASAQTKKPSAASESLDDTFHRLADEWQAAVAHHSSSSKRDNYPAYQAIIALGAPVVPLLLRDLEHTHRHWFTALRLITGANPISPDDAGKVAKMAEAWLRWGKEKG